MTDALEDIAYCHRRIDALLTELVQLKLAYREACDVAFALRDRVAGFEESRRERSRRLVDLAGRYAHRIDLNPASVGIWLAMDAIKDLP